MCGALPAAKTGVAMATAATAAKERTILIMVLIVSINS
jgi:hypothetical protein